MGALTCFICYTSSLNVIFTIVKKFPFVFLLTAFVPIDLPTLITQFYTLLVRYFTLVLYFTIYLYAI